MTRAESLPSEWIKMAFWHRSAKAPQGLSPDRDEAADRRAAAEPLGLQRQRVIVCLYGNMASYGHLFSLEEHETAFEAFRRFVLEADVRWRADADLLRLSIVAAGRLLTGY